MKLVPTKRTQAEKTAEKAKYDKPSRIGGDEYPYSTRLCLDERMLKKLGLNVKDFKVGHKVRMELTASVRSLRATEGKDHDSSELELQIEHMGLEKVAKGGSMKDAVSSAIQGAQDD